MSKTKTKHRPAAAPRVQAPKQRIPEGRRLGWLVWVAASGPMILAAVLLVLFWPGKNEAPSSSDAGPAAAGLPDTPDYHSLLVAPRDPNRVFLGSHAGLHESTDGGRTWSPASLQGQDAMNLARTPQGTVWAAGHEVLAKSSDGGQTWEDAYPDGLPSRDVHGFAVDRKDPQRLYAAVANEGLYRSTDGGASFELLSEEVGPAVMALAIKPDGAILAGDMQQGLMVSRDEGRTWSQILAEGLMGLAIHPRDPNRVLATGPGILLSTDGGKSWRRVLPIEAGAGPVAWSPSNPRVAYVVGFDKLLYRTNDRGASWQPVV